MNIHRRNKKTLIGIVSTMTVAVLILTGTFAWSTFQQSITGARNETFEYVVMLLEEDYKPIYKNNNWIKDQVISKPVYASSIYEEDSSVKTEYEKIVKEYSDEGLDEPVFSNTWVRIKLEETFIKNGTPTTEIVKQMNAGKLVSSFGGTDGYFELLNNDTDTVIKKIADWTGEYGRFWILDEDGWMYWAQPVLAPTTDSTSPDQETDHIIDEVKLIKQPSGTWEYKITATLDAMDVELQGYKGEGAWGDIENIHSIYPLFGDIKIDEINFPDENFRTWIATNVTGAMDGFLSQTEINEITGLEIKNQNFIHLDLAGINYFRNLESLDVSENSLRKLDIPDLTNHNITSFVYEPQYHNSAGIPMILETNTESRKEWAIDEDRYDQDLNVLFNELNFPDAEFRAYLVNGPFWPDTDHWKSSYIDNARISQENLKKIEKININKLKMANLKGIEHFPNIRELRVYHMPNLTRLELNKNKKLTILDAHSNQKLINLDVSNNILMYYLNIYNSPLLCNLDVRNNSSLRELRAFDMPNLANLDLKNNQRLTLLEIYNNPSLTSLELAANIPFLTSLSVHNSQLSSLDISGIPSGLKIDDTKFRYDPQLKEDKTTNKTLLTSLPLTSATNLLEWE